MALCARSMKKMPLGSSTPSAVKVFLELSVMDAPFIMDGLGAVSSDKCHETGEPFTAPLAPRCRAHTELVISLPCPDNEGGGGALSR
jgi:hypothetical protein